MRVLLVRAGALGDVVLLRRAIAGLKRAGHELTLLAPLGSGLALKGPGLSAVDDLIDWDDPALLPLFGDRSDRLEEVRPRFEGFDSCIAYTRQEGLVSRLETLIPWVLTCSPQPTGGHASEWLARPIAHLVASAAPLPPDLESTADEVALADAFVRSRLPPHFVAVHPGSGSTSKNWPANRFAELVAESAEGSWLLVEGPADSSAAAALSRAPGAVRGRSFSPRVLGAVLSRSGLYVGNDSGVSHLAAAFGAPSLALFGPTDPAVWSPVGRRARSLRSPTGTMDGLAVSDVVAAARDLRRAAALESDSRSTAPGPRGG